MQLNVYRASETSPDVAGAGTDVPEPLVTGKLVTCLAEQDFKLQHQFSLHQYHASDRIFHKSLQCFFRESETTADQFDNTIIRAH